MPDVIETLRRSTLQHGKLNDRIFLLKLAPEDCPDILPLLDELADQRGYTKIVAKVPTELKEWFVRWGYHREARIPGFFNARDRRAVELMARYPDPGRSLDPDPDRTETVLAAALKEQGAGRPAPPAPPYHCRIAEKGDTPQMAALYRDVFPTYPFPIHDPAYLDETMDGHSRYAGIWKGDRLVSLASAEMDPGEKNAEMTDFATRPRHRGQRFAGFLLGTMEAAMAAAGIRTGYTIARSRSFGMNITFARAGYSYGGTLVNNTQIAGRIESMNIWYKALGGAGDALSHPCRGFGGWDTVHLFI